MMVQQQLAIAHGGTAAQKLLESLRAHLELLDARLGCHAAWVLESLRAKLYSVESL